MSSDVDGNESPKEFIKTVLDVIKFCTDKRQLLRKCDKIVQWITNGLLKSINIKTAVFKRLQKYPDNVELKNEYSTFRNKLNILTKINIQYFASQIDRNSTKSKNL